MLTLAAACPSETLGPDLQADGGQADAQTDAQTDVQPDVQPDGQPDGQPDPEGPPDDTGAPDSGPDGAQDNTHNDPQDGAEGSHADAGTGVPGGDAGGPTGDGAGESEGDSAPGDSQPVRFVALGDTGEGNEAQYAVAAVIEDVCLAQGCDFALLLGDNFYDTGVEGLDDPQWQTKFEEPYALLDFPFYPVLGNHDGGIFGAGIQIEPGNVQVEYSSVSSKWTMPSRWYMHTHENADFFALDTSTMFFEELGLDYDDLVEEQRQFLAAHLTGDASDRWRFAYAHHPYVSNGKHGNAGSYDGISFSALVSGEPIKDFVEENLCGKVDFFLCGHDHNRQWHVADCAGTEFIVSGAGAKLTTFEDSQPVHYASDALEGFVWFEVLGRTLKVQFWNRAGELEFERTLTK